jgi:hypothetical protein
MVDLHHPCGLQLEVDHRTGDVPLHGDDGQFNHHLELRAC